VTIKKLVEPAHAQPTRGRAGKRHPSDLIDRQWVVICAAAASAVTWGRGGLLTALDQPPSTTQLARSLGLATGAVGDHLTILHRAGLLTKAGPGARSSTGAPRFGDALITASPARPPQCALGRPVVVRHTIDVVPLTMLARLSRNRQPTDLNRSP